MYKECPNPYCQGLIAPDHIKTTEWTYEPIAHNILRSRRTIYIYCPTCNTAFELIEEANRPGWAEYHAYTNYTDIRRIRRKLPAFASLLKQSTKITYEPTMSVSHTIGVA